MKYVIGFLVSILLLSIGFWLGLISKEGFLNDNISNLFTGFTNKPKINFEVYSLDSLSQADIKPGNIEIIKKTQDNKNYSSYLFKFTFYPNPEKDYEKSTTGVINIPKDTKNLPTILMIRGYVDQEYYVSGMGTKRSSEYFSENGFITIAPDFLGYGESSSESENIFEARFQTYTTTLAILKTLELLPNGPDILTGISDNQTLKLKNSVKLFIWAHSNGGQIALTTLAITQKYYPTVLWAPVTKPFPYSILYYTDESDDGGKLLRNELSTFEKYYNTEKYSFTYYLDRIKSPIQIYQGTSDHAVPLEWNESFISKLQKFQKEKGLSVKSELIIKQGADHNLMPLWDESIMQSLEFFQTFVN